MEQSFRKAAVCLGEVRNQPVEWLWPGYLPRGTLVLLDGDPGLGKSFLTLDLAARLSAGKAMPPEEGKGTLPPLDVLLLNAEDDLLRTLRPRLEAQGADLFRIHALTEIDDGIGPRPLSLPEDLTVIEYHVQRTKAALVVIDPFMAYLAGTVDSHRDHDVRRVLHKLKRLAERTQAAILLVRHLTKNHASHDPLYRGGGSIGIIGAARTAWLAGRHPADEELRVLCRLKGNLGEVPSSLAYGIEQHRGALHLQWEGIVPYGPFDLLVKPTTPMGRPPEASEEAITWLKEALKNGPQVASMLGKLAKLQDISASTLRRAKEKLGVEVLRPAKPGEPWRWKLPK
jgi:RecA-family ATPase